MSVIVAYLGPQGTFTEEALWALADKGQFGAHKQDIELLACTSPREAIDAIHAGHAHFACVAIENSVDGAVTPTFDALASANTHHSGVQIYAELDLPIAFSAMKRQEIVADKPTVATHPVAYRQVKGWLADNIGEHEFLAASSNAAAAHMVARGQADIAIAPRRAAEICGLSIIAEEVADVPGARTRFVVVGLPGPVPQPTGIDRTAVIFTVRNEPGSLVRLLTEFSLRGVDLTRIESRPTTQKLGMYRFQVDIAGHIDDLSVAEALRAVYVHCDSIHFLGSWPADTPDAEKKNAQDNKLLASAQQWVRDARAGRRTPMVD
ncbi:prephenate dehydratase [Corynebacterium sp. sy017]|uniref:prephenate dehydratase n=1 Tax=unclassified Corynebacterium TaxID=2624378 RepID=UPI0011850369|nr:MULTISPECIES: prephenate dehydratase [unclassified Corynebacterium]MBP3089448.1 prephenate dehydratase [Corynebacterium sp. sy017]TSD90870.1 prephenate dehydratase [Corynebacterium sp. SY003]